MQIHAFVVYLPWKIEIEALIKQKRQKLYCPDNLGQEYCRQILVYDKKFDSPQAFRYRIFTKKQT